MAPAILAASQIVTPGGYFFVAASTDIDSVEVRVGGVPVHGSPWYLNPDGEFGIFQVPTGTDLGPTRVSIRVPGGDNDSDHVAIEVVEPTFVDVSKQTGLSFVHDASDFPEECAEAMTGLGSESVRPPRLPLAGAQRERVRGILETALAARPLVGRPA